NRKDIKKDTLIKLAIIIGIIIAVNVISTRIFTRIDLTKNSTYTLSPISREVVANLQDNLVIKAFFSDNLPAPYNTLRRQVQDFLNDYRSYSNGNLNYEFLNPVGEDDNNELQKEAQKFGIQPVQVQVIDNDKMEVKRAYLGIVFLYEGKQEVIPVIQSVSNLEYDITSTIKKLTTENKKKIGFTQGNGENDYTKYNNIMMSLSAQYDVVPVNMSQSKSIPPDISTLIVMAPKAEVPEWQKFLLDQFIMKGGNVAFLVNKVVPNFQQQIAIGDQVNVNLDDMFSSYGIVLKNDLVRDAQCAPVQVQSAIGFPIQISYPYFPNVSNINREISAFKNIPSVVLTFVSSLDMNAANGKNIKAVPLLTTSDKSGIAEGFYLLNIEQFQNLRKTQYDSLFNTKNIVVGAVYEGNFTSHYSGKPIPQDTTQGSQPYSGAQLTNSQKSSKIVVIGDGDFANEEQRPPKENITFFINLVDYLADDAGLTQIRSKDVSEAPIEAVTDGTKKFIKYFNLIFPPAAVLLLGLFIWNKKKLKKKALQNK
ncbi:MAG: GldG family protein, partial [Ignavibacteria bacterium]|nr:GldG family protein [Ignavibacteria bacterium]